MHLSAPQPPQCLAEEFTAGAGDVVERRGGQDVQLRAEFGDERVQLRLDGLGLRAHATDLAEDLGELDEVPDLPRAVGRVPVRPVGQFLHPVQDADRERLAALGAEPLGVAGARGLPVHAAGPVPVGVVLALLGEELDRPL